MKWRHFRNQGLAVLSVLSVWATKESRAQGWVELSSGLPTDYTASAIGGGNGNELYMGAGGDGVYRSVDNGLNWAAANTGLLANGQALPPLAFARLGTGRLVRGGTVASWDNRAGSAVFYSDNGTSWTEAPFPFLVPSVQPNGALAFVDLVLHNAVLYASDALSHGVWKSSDGVQWTPANTGLPYTNAVIFQFQKTNGIASDGSFLVTVTDLGGVYRSADDGGTWQQANTGISATYNPLYGDTWNGVDVAAAVDGSAIYAVVEGGLFKSVDHGANWTDAAPGLFGTGGVLGNARAIATAAGNAVYVISTTGRIAESTDAGGNWTELDRTNLPNGVTVGGFESNFLAHNGALYVLLNEKSYRADLTTLPRVPLAPGGLVVDSFVQATVGGSVALTVSVTAGTAPFTYQWYKDGNALAGATANLYAISSAQESDSGTYTVAVSNASGTVTSNPIVLSVVPDEAGYLNTDFDIGAGVVDLFFGAPVPRKARRLASRPDGKLAVGYDSWSGNYTGTINGVARSRVAVVATDGAVDSAFDTSAVFPGTSNQTEITALFTDPEGLLYVGYDQADYTGVTGTNPYLERLLSTGQLDPSFTIDDGSGAGFRSGSEVQAVARQSDGKILVGGKLVLSDATYQIVRLLSDGTVDSSFTKLHLDNYKVVTGLHVLDDDRFIASGGYYAGAFSGVERFLANGTLDWSFDANVEGSMDDLAVGEDGAIYAVGSTAIIKLLADGSPDPGFNRALAIPNANVYCVAVEGNGKILIGGQFSSISGTPAFSLARLNPDGSLDSTFRHGTYLTRDGNNTAIVYDLLYLPTGMIIVAGYIHAYDGIAISGILALNGDQVNLAIVSPPQDVSVTQGAPASFSVTGYGTSTISYQWYHDGVPIAGATSATYAIASTTAADSGLYSVMLSNVSGTKTSRSAQLVVLGIPQISTAPEHQFLLAGDNAVLSVEAIGASPLTYQWKKDGADIPGEVGTSLTLTNVDASAAGQYTVSVSNSFGTTESPVAVVALIDPPAGETANAGDFSWVSGITDAAMTSSGRIYIGGAFNAVGSHAQQFLARLNADGTFDAGFQPDTSFYYIVGALVAAPDGGVFVGAYINTFGGTFRKHLVIKYLADGTRDTTFDGGLGTANRGANGLIGALVLQTDGKILVGGSFSSVDGDTSQRYLVRYLADGSLDTSFSSGVIQGPIYSLQVLSDGRILVAGFFSASGRAGTSNIAILHADGSLDSDFSGSNAPNFSVYKAIEQADGKILAGGRFTAVGSTSKEYLVRYNADGSIDPSFAPADFNSNGVIRHLALGPDGTVLVAGDFTTINGETRYRIAALNSDGTLNSLFRPDPGANNSVSRVLINTNGQIFISGSFGTYNGINRTGYTILKGFPVPLSITTQPVDQAVDPGGNAQFSVVAQGLDTPTYQWRKDGVEISGATAATLTVNNAALTDAGSYDVVVSNVFGLVTSDSARLIVRDAPVILQQPTGVSGMEEGESPVVLSVVAEGIAPLAYQWKHDGIDVPGATAASLDLSPVTTADNGAYYVVVSNALGTVASNVVTIAVTRNNTGVDWRFQVTAPPPDGVVYHVNPRPDGSVLVAGSFSATAGGNQYLTRYLADGSEDSTFSPQINGLVRTTYVLGDGRILIGGEFSTVDGNTRRGVARLNTDGSLDTTFVPPTETISSNFGTPKVYALEVDINGNVYVGGNLYVPSSDNASVMKLATDGTLDAAFTANLQYGVYALTWRDENTLLVGGSFTTGNTEGHAYLIALHRDGTTDSTFAGNGAPSGTVYDIAVTRWGSLLIGGDFSAYAGENQYALVKTDLSGNRDSAFSLGTRFNSGASVRQVEVTLDGTVLAAGTMTTLDAAPIGHIAAFHLQDGTSDTDFDFGPGFNNSVYALQVMNDGRILAGGEFTAYRLWNPMNRLVMINGRYVALAVTADPLDVTVEQGGNAVFSVTAYSDSTITYQWLKDGVELPGENASTLSLTTLTDADEGAYAARLSNATSLVTSGSANLRVLNRPEFDRQPANATFTFTGMGELSAEVVGAGVLSYQWYRNEQTVNGATTSVLHFSPVDETAPGFYFLEATNSFGTTRSETVTVQAVAMPGALDTSFDVGTGPNNEVYVAVPLADGRIVVGGAHATWNGEPWKGLLRLTDAGAIDSTFDSKNKLTSYVNDVAVDPAGMVYAGGFISAYNGSASHLIRVGDDGVRDATFTPALGTYGGVMDILLLGSGKVLICGHFSQAVARLNTDGSFDPAFDAQEASDSVSGARLLSSGRASRSERYLVYGFFTAIGGQSGLHGLAVLDADGNYDTAFTAELPTGTGEVTAVAVDAAGKVYLGVTINTYTHKVLRLNSDGSADTSWADVQASGRINSLFTQADGRLLVGGNFTYLQVQSVFSNKYLARLNADGTIDSTFMNGMSGFNGGVYSVTRDANARILVTGAFTSVNGTTANRVARLLGDGPVLGIVAVSQNVTASEGESVQLDVIAVGPGALTYQWYSGETGDESAPVTGGTTASLTTPTLNSTSRFWVRVSDGASSVDSSTIVVTVVSRPVIAVDPAEITLDVYAAAPDLLTGVTAEDYAGTDLTASIAYSVNGNGAVDTATLGDYEVTYDVQDAGGRDALSGHRTYHVVDRTAPQLTVTPAAISLPLNRVVDVLEGVSVVDNYDQSVPISLGGDTLNTAVAGDYTVTYTAVDTSQNSVIRTRVYHVLVDTTAPVITLSPETVELAVGAVLPNLLQGASAVDDLSGDLSSSIQTSWETEPTTAIPDDYTVTYRVTDESGNLAEDTRLYRVRHVAEIDNDSDGLDDNWERLNFGTGQRGAAEDALRWLGTDDADGDGLTNFDEFGLGLDPRAYTLSLSPGWNLVTLRHTPVGDQSIDTLMVDGSGNPVIVGLAWNWDAIRHRYVPALELSAFTGTWVYCLAPADVVIDLDANAPPPARGGALARNDADGDGLDDDWETTNFGDTRFLASDDPDGDGLTNIQEQDAGTDPFGFVVTGVSDWNLLSVPHSPAAPDVYTPVPFLIMWIWDAGEQRYRIRNGFNASEATWSFLPSSAGPRVDISITP